MELFQLFLNGFCSQLLLLLSIILFLFVRVWMRSVLHRRRVRLARPVRQGAKGAGQGIRQGARWTKRALLLKQASMCKSACVRVWQGSLLPQVCGKGARQRRHKKAKKGKAVFRVGRGVVGGVEGTKGRHVQKGQRAVCKGKNMQVDEGLCVAKSSFHLHLLPQPNPPIQGRK